jgi:hypothetical protein
MYHAYYSYSTVLKIKKFEITNFRLSQWLNVDVDSDLGLLRCVTVVVGDVAGVSEAHAASIFRV